MFYCNAECQRGDWKAHKKVRFARPATCLPLWAVWGTAQRGCCIQQLLRVPRWMFARGWCWVAGIRGAQACKPVLIEKAGETYWADSELSMLYDAPTALPFDDIDAIWE